MEASELSGCAINTINASFQSVTNARMRAPIKNTVEENTTELDQPMPVLIEATLLLKKTTTLLTCEEIH